MKQFLLQCLGVFVLIGMMTLPVQAEQTLEEQVQSLSRQNRIQSELLQDLQKKVSGKESVDTDKGKELLKLLSERIEFNGLMEVEIYSEEDFEGDETSDIDLASVELDIHATISDWSKAHLLLMYEERDDDDDFFVDEGTITLGNVDRFPVLLIAGRMYVHFGAYYSNMIADPLTLELGETNTDAVQIIAEKNGFYGTVYCFNGDTDETGKDDGIKTYGLNGGYSMSNDTMSVEFGIDWLNNIADSGELADYIATTSNTIDDQVSGIGVHGSMEFQRYTFICEYLAALDNFALGEVDFRGQGAQPESYNVELAYSTDVLNRPMTFAIGYQGTDEAVDLDFPEERYISTVKMEVFPSTILAVEYFHDEDYSKTDGGTGKDAESITMQLALEF